MLTHIHLAHAGATGTLLRRYPQLRAYVHARGAPHMLAPERLVQSATRIYGDQMERLWGEFAAVPAERLTILVKAARRCGWAGARCAPSTRRATPRTT